jgi:hypothetical protein
MLKVMGRRRFWEKKFGAKIFDPGEQRVWEIGNLEYYSP